MAPRTSRSRNFAARLASASAAASSPAPASAAAAGSVTPASWPAVVRASPLARSRRFQPAPTRGRETPHSVATHSRYPAHSLPREQPRLAPPSTPAPRRQTIRPFAPALPAPRRHKSQLPAWLSGSFLSTHHSVWYRMRLCFCPFASTTPFRAQKKAPGLAGRLPSVQIPKLVGNLPEQPEQRS